MCNKSEYIKRKHKEEEARNKRASQNRVWLANYLNKNLGCNIDVELVR